MAAIIFNAARQADHIPCEPATVAAQLRPLDPDIVSDAIPAFFIGRNMERLAASSCLKAQRWGLRGEIASRRDARRYFHPIGSNSI